MSEIGATLYDLNKGLTLQEDILKDYEVKDQVRQIIKPFIKRSENQYFMLLNREQYDFTLFNFGSPTPDEDALNLSVKDITECLINRGGVTTIEETQDSIACEIWLIIDGEAFAYYFFPYDAGVIEEGIK